ncbi:MAG: hypothetical protein U0175_25625 [Caldilineaceae bacterium]
MPVLIDQVSAEIEAPPREQFTEQRAQPVTEPTPQQQQDALRRKLRQMEQRRMRLKAD